MDEFAERDDILKKVVDTMKMQLNELQMCKLKLERQENIWTN